MKLQDILLKLISSHERVCKMLLDQLNDPCEDPENVRLDKGMLEMEGIFLEKLKTAVREMEKE